MLRIILCLAIGIAHAEADFTTFISSGASSNEPIMVVEDDDVAGIPVVELPTYNSYQPIYEFDADDLPENVVDRIFDEEYLSPEELLHLVNEDDLDDKIVYEIQPEDFASSDGKYFSLHDLIKRAKNNDVKRKKPSKSEPVKEDNADEKAHNQYLSSHKHHEHKGNHHNHHKSTTQRPLGNDQKDTYYDENGIHIHIHNSGNYDPVPVYQSAYAPGYDYYFVYYDDDYHYDDFNNGYYYYFDG